MKEKLQLFFSKITRLISNEDVSFKIYLVAAIVALLTIGLFGVFPGLKTVYENYKLVLEMKNTNVMLTKKIQDLETAKSSLDNVGNNVLYLKNSLPANFDIQNYMVIFVFAAGNADLVVDRFTPYDNQGNAVDILVNLIGNGDLYRLISNLESINRVSEVQDIRVKKAEAYNEITLKVRTFIMEKLSSDK